MTMKYYIQEIAGNYLKNLSTEAESMKVAPCFLYGTDRQDFISGFNSLIKLFHCIYSDIRENPAAFGMLLKEMEVSDAKNSDYTKSGQSFLRVPNLLFLLGLFGELQSDMTLSISGNTLISNTKELKITGLPILMNRLADYGFVMGGLKKTVKDTDLILISYPDNRYLTAALKAMADATLTINKGEPNKNKNFFYILHNGLLENEKVKSPKLSLDIITRTLDGDKRRIAAMLDNAVGGECKKTVRMGGLMRNDWSCVYTTIAGKKVLMSLNIAQDKLDAKLNLQNIGKYIDVVDKYPEKVRETIKTSGWECGRCHDTCAGPFSFEMEGREYNKCRCGAFLFQNVSSDEAPYCVELLNREMEQQKA